MGGGAQFCGPPSSAIATLLDFGWQLPKINEWVSPDGVTWGLDYVAPNFMPMLKELLGVFFQQQLWRRAQIFPDALSPDLTDARALRRGGAKKPAVIGKFIGLMLSCKALWRSQCAT